MEEDEKKTKKQLLNELAEMRQRAAELEASEDKYKQARNALLESESRFRSIAETASDAIIIFDGLDRINENKHVKGKYRKNIA